MGKKLSIGAAVALMAVTAAITFTLSYRFAMQRFNDTMANVNERQAMYNKLSEVDTSVRQNYLGEIDEEALTNGICGGYISGLQDTQGLYMSAEKYREYLSSASKTSFGIGVDTLRDQNGNAEVVTVIPASPAEKAGIQKGDLITTVDGADIRLIGYSTALTRLDGEAGVSVALEVVRRAEPQEGEEQGSLVTLHINVVHEEYQDVTVEAYKLDNGLGYLSIRKFTSNTLQQYQNAIEKLKAEGVSGIVFDLRNCAGGDVDAAAQLLDAILPAGNLIGTVDKKGEQSFSYQSDSRSLDLPFSVLVNSATVGAGELFASAVKDYGRAEVVGETTAGKGTKNKIFPLSDGSAVELSIAHYITPKSGVFTGAGIAPTKQISLTSEQRALLDRKNLPEASDPQLQAAATTLGAVTTQQQESSAPPEAEPEPSSVAEE